MAPIISSFLIQAITLLVALCVLGLHLYFSGHISSYGRQVAEIKAQTDQIADIKRNLAETTLAIFNNLLGH